MKMYHPARKKSYIVPILILIHVSNTQSRSFQATERSETNEDSFDNNIIDFDEEYATKYSKKYGIDWNDGGFNKKTHRYTIVNDIDEFNHNDFDNKVNITTTEDYRVIPLELITTTENKAISIIESTTEVDLTVIPLSTTQKVPNITIPDTITLPVSTDNPEPTSTEPTELIKQENTSTTETLKTTPENETKLETTTVNAYENDEINVSTENFDETTIIELVSKENYTEPNINKEIDSTTEGILNTTGDVNNTRTDNYEIISTKKIDVVESNNDTESDKNDTKTITESNIFNTTKLKMTNETKQKNVDDIELTKTNLNITKKSDNNTKIAIIYATKVEPENRTDLSKEFDTDVPIFTELDAEEELEVPEDYYDTKDVVPTTPPKTDALSVIFGLAGSVVETVAERVVPKGVFDLFKRMQRQSEALESERLRSKEENGGIGQFTRGIIKTISTGISRPFSQLMAGARDIGSLDTDRGFVSSLASGVTSVANVANSVVDTFKDRVQAIYPGTVWCGDGRSATARSSDLGLFFFTDTCCRQHDACKLYIRAGETKHGLTNTGLFTRSHCSCDAKFKDCLRRTNSLVSAQIGLTYFNVLGPQCFRRAHPIVRCVRRTRITGLKCEEYELDYTKPRMWQWFDNETF